MRGSASWSSKSRRGDWLIFGEVVLIEPVGVARKLARPRPVRDARRAPSRPSFIDRAATSARRASAAVAGIAASSAVAALKLPYRINAKCSVQCGRLEATCVSASRLSAGIARCVLLQVQCLLTAIARIWHGGPAGIVYGRVEYWLSRCESKTVSVASYQQQCALQLLSLCCQSQSAKCDPAPQQRKDSVTDRIKGPTTSPSQSG